ncbi:MAG: hypothetical protein PVI72_17895 [Desulfobacterales bacterium]|jgi:hypothetical protein
MPAPINARIGWVVIGLLVWLTPPGPLFGSATDVLTYDLQQAREKLRMNLAFRDRIAAELQTLKQSKRADPDTVAAYEAYLNQVQAVVAEDRKTVAQLEALNAKYAAPAASLPEDSDLDFHHTMDPNIPEEQVEDEVAILDRELDTSLAAFDSMLLTELELIRAKSAERMRDLSEEVAAAARRLKEKGIDLESESSSDSADTSDDTQGQERSETSESPPDDAAASQEPTSGEGPASKGPSEEPQTGIGGTSRDRDDRYAGQDDDDIVARQLREAAEKETDPELKAKLWKEYEAYKKNSRQTD